MDLPSDTTQTEETKMSLPEDARPEADAAHRYWQVIWLKCIAHSWADKTFKDDLIQNPRLIIQGKFNYPLPEQLELTIVEADPAKYPGYKYPLYYDPADPNRDHIDFRDLPANRLTMVLPPAPAEHKQAVALAHYIDAGRSYPFTCCW